MGKINLGSIKTLVPSTRYVCFLPCLQASPDSLTKLIDRSGKGNHAVAGSGGIGAAAWSTTANCFSAPSTADAGAYLAKTAYADWTWGDGIRDSLVFSAQVYSPYTAASDTIFRTGTSASTGGWWIETGAAFGSGSTPGAKLKFYDTAAGSVDTVGNINLTANTWQTVTAIIDGPGNQAYLFVNGVLAPVTTSTNPRALTDVSIMTPQPASVNPWIMSSPTGHSETTYGKKTRAIHFAVIPQSAGAIASPVALAMRLHRNGFTPLATNELP